MTRVFITTSEGKRLKFASEHHAASFRDYLKENEGEEFRITKNKASLSEKMRAYYWAVVIPTVRDTVPEWFALSSSHTHEALKKMFNGFDVYNPATKRPERFGGSIMNDDCKTEEGMEYIEKIAEFLMTQYQVGLPSPEEHKYNRDTNIQTLM